MLSLLQKWARENRGLFTITSRNRLVKDGDLEDISAVPTVLRKDGFNFMIYPDDHEPIHTHVKKAGKEVVINLGDENIKPYERENKGMSLKTRRKALRLIGEHQDYLIEKWKEIHGDA